MNHALMERFLKLEAVSVAAVPLESCLREKATIVPNVLQEKSHRSQVGARARLALPEHLKPTGKSAAHAHKGGFLQ